MSTAQEFRVVGWDPFKPGSIVWLARDHWSVTRNPAQALTLGSYQEADAAAIAACAEQVNGLTRWMPAKASRDLKDLQAHERRPADTTTKPVASNPPSVQPRKPRSNTLF